MSYSTCAASSLSNGSKRRKQDSRHTNQQPAYRCTECNAPVSEIQNHRYLRYKRVRSFKPIDNPTEITHSRIPLPCCPPLPRVLRVYRRQPLRKKPWVVMRRPQYPGPYLADTKAEDGVWTGEDGTRSRDDGTGDP